MPSPLYNAIKGTTAGTPGTGAFTPNAAASGFRAWTKAPTGWIGMVRYEDGSSWELSFSYWNGATLSRGANQLFDSSTGSQISLTSSATAAMIADASEVMPHLGGTYWVGTFGAVNTSVTALRGGTTVETGTASSVALSSGSIQGAQPRRVYTSATTANAQAGWTSPNPWGVSHTTAGWGGFEYSTRFSVTTIPTGARFMCGMATNTFIGQTIEPSAWTASYAAFAKDSTDTNWQLLTNSGTTGGTKINTGVAPNTGELYEMSIWMEPGGGTVYGLLLGLVNGTIWYGSTTTDIPGIQTLLAHTVGGLSSTTGTAVVMQISSMMVRGGV